VRVKVSEHARFDSFPLRYGIVPDEFLETSSEVEDAKATGRQKPQEIKAGNKHVVCQLWTLDGESLGKARIVIAPRRGSDEFDTIVTVLSVDEILSDRAVSEIVRDKRLRGEITTDFIRSTLHPLYVKKRLSSPDSLVNIFVDAGLAEERRKNEQLQDENEGLKKKNQDEALKREEAENQLTAQAKIIAALKEQAANPPGVPSRSDQAGVQDLRTPAKAVTEQWLSKTGSNYMNVGVEAFIEDVYKDGYRIYLKFINSKGQLQEIYDFGDSRGYVESKIFDYLDSRKKQRAVFLITFISGQPSRLASNTMMLDSYRHLWR
jgi:hypothetical protein